MKTKSKQEEPRRKAAGERRNTKKTPAAKSTAKLASEEQTVGKDGLAIQWREEVVSVSRLVPYERNPRKIDDLSYSRLKKSLQESGYNARVMVTHDYRVVAGHQRIRALKELGIETLAVLVPSRKLSDQEFRRILVQDNLSFGEFDPEILVADFEVEELAEWGMAESLLAAFEEPEVEHIPPFEPEDETPPVRAQAVSVPGDIWLLGPHKLIVGDCREFAVVEKLLGGGSLNVNVAVTSPPYASQREYDASSGFKPIPVEEYTEWFRDVAANIQAVLADDGSYFLNIKEHAQDGERSLYVKDLVLAHKREWGWLFVDEFCWRKTDNGVPGSWPNRFKNAFEPVFHFSKSTNIKFRPDSVMHESEAAFDSTHKVSEHADGRRFDVHGAPSVYTGETKRRIPGQALPSNVVEVSSEKTQGSHSAPYPRALVEFFINAFSDKGDVVFDPFMGSGTTIAAAEATGRIGVGCEISPLYADVVVRRWEAMTKREATNQETGRTFKETEAKGRNVA